jgi:hypothetical protein
MEIKQLFPVLIATVLFMLSGCRKEAVSTDGIKYAINESYH